MEQIRASFKRKAVEVPTTDKLPTSDRSSGLEPGLIKKVKLV